MVIPGSGWLTTQEAVSRTRASAATIKRYAAAALPRGDAALVLVAPKGVKQAWRIEPGALDLWATGRRRAAPAPAATGEPSSMSDALRPPAMCRLTADAAPGVAAPGPLSRSTPAPPVAPTAEPSVPPADQVSPPPTLETRLMAVETGLRSLISIVGSVSAATDDARAARTVSLIEKSVTEDVRAAYLAQQDAIDSEARARAALEQVVDHTRASSEARARAAAALGRAFDGRSRQLDQLLTPGSAATLDEPQPGS